jgi:4'-phosphopantetheinyl transferase
VISAQVATGVHVGVAELSTMDGRAPHPGDARAAAALPAPRAAEYIAARSVLRRLLADVAGPAAARLSIGARPGGQPYLPGRPDLAVSLSHGGGWVAAALGVGAAVGVDVQAPEPVSTGLLRRCCTPAARAELAGLPVPARDREFARIWTVQEACVKAAGVGLAGRPWTIPVGVGQRTGSWRHYRWQSVPGCRAVPASCAYQQAPG